MKTAIAPEAVETIAEEPVPANSKKREITASVVAGVVTVTLGLVASGLIERISGRVKNAIAPKPEKPETESE